MKPCQVLPNPSSASPTPSTTLIASSTSSVIPETSPTAQVSHTLLICFPILPALLQTSPSSASAFTLTFLHTVSSQHLMQLLQPTPVPLTPLLVERVAASLLLVFSLLSSALPVFRLQSSMPLLHTKFSMLLLNWTSKPSLLQLCSSRPV